MGWDECGRGQNGMSVGGGGMGDCGRGWGVVSVGGSNCVYTCVRIYAYNGVCFQSN